MKKKLLILLIIFISFTFMSRNIYAKDLEIHATKKTIKEDNGIEFITYAGAYQNSVNSWISANRPWGTIVYDNGNSSDYNYVIAYKNGLLSDWNTNTIRSTSFLIHNKPFSKYQDTSSGEYGHITYISKNENKINSKNTNITGENTGVSAIEFRRKTYGYTIEDFGVDHVTKTFNFFPKSYLNKIMENLDKYKAGKTDNSYYCYISEPYAWRLDGVVAYSERSVYKGLENKIENYDVGLKTSYDVKTNHKLTSGDLPSLFGISGKNGTAISSFLNAYDNKIYFPINAFDKNKVYIRHIDEKGNSLGCNDEEILIASDGTESLISNSTPKNPDDNHKSDFPEYYELNSGEKLRVSRLLDLVVNKKYYHLENIVVSSGNSYKAALDNQEKATPDTTHSKKQINPSNKVTVITFNYKVEDIPSPKDPNGGIKTLKEGSESGNCRISYTPTGAKIIPYLQTKKYVLDELTYGYNIDTSGEKTKYTYIMNSFNIYKLENGTIANNDDANPKITGKIFGGEDDKLTLLQGNVSSKNFSYSGDNILNIFDDFIKTYKNALPTRNVLKNTFINNSKNITEKDEFEDGFKVPENRYNGLRQPKLIANYKKYKLDIDNNKWKNITGGFSEGTSNKLNVVVYNPIKVEAPTVKTENFVNHSDKENTAVIQKNANFELTINSASGEYYVGKPYSEYLKTYYLIFDIDIIKTSDTEYSKLYEVRDGSLKGISVSEGGVIPSGTIIELSTETKTFKAKAGNNVDTGDVISQTQSSITLIGVSNNMPGDALKNYVLNIEKDIALYKKDTVNYISKEKENNSSYIVNNKIESVERDYCEANIVYDNYRIHKKEYYEEKNMYFDAYYFAKATQKIENIGRIYDFKVTDCSDIDFKNVFRKQEANNVNTLTGIEYFSGIKKLEIYTSGINTLKNRENLNIGNNTTSKKIIPLGPYKNTNTSYIKAPKMGYRISFDLKTSGFYDYKNSDSSSREILITPSYYYISKDGKTFKNNINLYYKNSSGKYVKFEGSNYTIYFKPNDGYRFKSNSDTAGNTTAMSKQLEPLNISSSDGFILNSKMMSTADNQFIQAWYGEFKLPNSTIAVEGSNVSKPLTDGYIGVKFEIECIDNKGKTNEKVLSYNIDNKNDSPNTNTTQWDYEGFLEFKDPGRAANNLTLQLEKGIWNIDNDTYKDIKGTVVLFDTDNRAANDFD